MRPSRKDTALPHGDEQSAVVRLADNPFLETSAITSDAGVTGRCLRNWIASGRFPPPDANIGGRNFWLTSTYIKWKQSALDGKYVARIPLAKRFTDAKRADRS